MSIVSCRFCKKPIRTSLVNLGKVPLANSFLPHEDLRRAEKRYPLRVRVCEHCFLAQLKVFEPPESIFTNYPYFSSYSDSWLRLMQRFAEKAAERFCLDQSTRVVEVASNDGYLLQYFKKRDIPILGIEPAENVVREAEKKGVPTIVKFFNAGLARELTAQGLTADFLVGNNVLAHVPDINDFVLGLSILLKPSGVLCMEFPHFLRLFERVLFDTIYHEHLSYLSLFTVEKIFASYGLTIFDVEEVPTQGGSIRIYARHSSNDSFPVLPEVSRIRQLEMDAKLDCVQTYTGFEPCVQKIKRDILKFLIDAKNGGRTVLGYGAPAKGNTFLTYCGISTDLLAFTVDRNPSKQNTYLPGVHIPVFSPARLEENRPDFVLILPWNIAEEIVEQLKPLHDAGTRFVVALPELRVF